MRPPQPRPGLGKGLDDAADGDELAKVADAQGLDAKVLGQDHRHEGQGQGHVQVGGGRAEHGGQGIACLSLVAALFGCRACFLLPSSAGTQRPTVCDSFSHSTGWPCSLSGASGPQPPKSGVSPNQLETMIKRKMVITMGKNRRAHLCSGRPFHQAVEALDDHLQDALPPAGDLLHLAA